MVACKTEQPNTPGGTVTSNIRMIEYDAENSIYYGEQYGEGTGYYQLTLKDNSNNSLFLSCFGTVASNASNARFTTGSYTPGNFEDREVRTFITTTGTDDSQYVTTVTYGGTEYPIDGGSVNVTASGSSYIITCELTSGESSFTINYEGSVSFQNESSFAPREEDPNPRPAAHALGQYFGQNLNPDATSGIFILDLGYIGDWDTGKNVEALQIYGYMPLQEDNNNVYLPDGTYTISQEASDNGEAFSLIPGSIDATTSTYSGSFEYYMDDNSILSKGYVITSGTMEVSHSDDTYVIEVNMMGLRSDKSSVIATPEQAEEIHYRYEGKLEPMVNSADANSTLTADKDLGTFSNQAVIQVIPGAAKDPNGVEVTAWLYYIFGEGITPTITDNSMSLAGTGDMIMLSLWGYAQPTDNPEGTFNFSNMYGIIDMSNGNCAMPANPYWRNSQYGLDPQNGCMYTNITNETAGIYVNEEAGAMPSQGHVTTRPSDTEGNQVVEFEFVDRYGYKLTGTYDGPMRVIKASGTSGMAASGYTYSPAFSVDNATNIHSTYAADTHSWRPNANLFR